MHSSSGTGICALLGQRVSFTQERHGGGHLHPGCQRARRRGAAVAAWLRFFRGQLGSLTPHVSMQCMYVYGNMYTHAFMLIPMCMYVHNMLSFIMNQI